MSVNLAALNMFRTAKDMFRTAKDWTADSIANLDGGNAIKKAGEYGGAFSALGRSKIACARLKGTSARNSSATTSSSTPTAMSVPGVRSRHAASRPSSPR